MAQPEAGRNTAGNGDPTSTEEILLKERGARVDSLLFSVRTKTLAETPEFQKALIASYFNPRGEHGPKIFFQRGDAGFDVCYTSDSHGDPVDRNDEQVESFTLAKKDYEAGGGVRILLEMIKHDGRITHARAEFKKYDTELDFEMKQNPSEEPTNEDAYPKIEEVLAELKPAEQTGD